MAAPMSAETAGYAFTPRQAKITSALEGLAPFGAVAAPANFTRDVAGAYALGDENPEAAAVAAYGGLQALGTGALQGLMAISEQQQALEAEERKHSRALDIEQIKSARSSDAIQKRIQYLRESAAQRLQEVGGNKKPPRRMIGEPSTAPFRGGGDVEDEESFNGEDPLEPNLNDPFQDLPPVEPDLPTYEENEPAVQEEKSLFNLNPPPLMPSGSDVIPAGAMRIDPEQAAQFATAQVGGAPQTLPSGAMGIPLTDLAAPINVAYIPSETARQIQELQQGVRDLTPSTSGAPLSQMAPPTTAAPAQFPAEMQPGAYTTYEEARRVAEMPLPETYERPVVEQRVDNETGETYWEVMPPKMKAPQTEAERLALEKAKVDLEKARTTTEETAAPPDEEKLRKEFLAESKTFEIVRDAWDNIKTSSRPDPVTQNFSPASDMAMVFSFMKLLDPTSVVRETEYANAARAAGVPERIVAGIDQVVRGTILGPDQRQDFLNTAKRLYARRVQAQQRLSTYYRGIAQAKGMNPDFVTPDLRSVDRKYDLEQKVREKAVEVQKAQAGTEEYDKAFEELKQLMREQKQAELEEEQAISIE